MSLNKSTDLKELKKFDIDLQFGQQWEKYIDDLLNGSSKIEVKTEKDIWANTGNLAMEYQYKGHDSGLKVTESDIWIENFVKDGEIYFSMLFPTDKLKEVCNFVTPRLTNGGDNNDSKLALYKIKAIIDGMIELANNKKVKCTHCNRNDYTCGCR
jgi:hypothetical protein